MKTLVKTLASLSLSVALVSVADAQRQTKPAYFFGIESSVGTKSVGFESNIQTIDHINLVQTGSSVGLVAGTNLITASIKTGNYENTSNVATPVTLKQLDLTTAFHPMQLFNNKKQKYFEVYLVTGASRGSVALSGIYTPQPETEGLGGLGAKAPVCACMCTDSGPLLSLLGVSSASQGPSSDPDLVEPSTEATEQEFHEKLSSTYVTMGLGLQARLVKKNYFANLFAEVKYGVQVTSKSNGAALAKTNANNQTAIDFGVRFGILKRK